jgi:hypothetical protein
MNFVFVSLQPFLMVWPSCLSKQSEVYLLLNTYIEIMKLDESPTYGDFLH